jgi:hypothetical protein
MDPDELRRHLDAIMDSVACDSCDAIYELTVRAYDGGPMICYPSVLHEPDCPRRAA